MKKAFSVILDILISIFCIFTIVNIYFTIVEKSPLCQLVQVQTESMKASGIEAGDIYVIYRKHNYDVGDVIAFKSNSGIIFHEIIGVDENNNFITKGSSNAAQDLDPVTQSNIIGKGIIFFKLNILNENWFRVFIILIPYTLIMIYLIKESLIVILEIIKEKNNYILNLSNLDIKPVIKDDILSNIEVKLRKLEERLKI